MPGRFPRGVQSEYPEIDGCDADGCHDDLNRVAQLMITFFDSCDRNSLEEYPATVVNKARLLA
jgi:hypothetical protein